MLQTPVTSAPNALPICTAKVPTPPAAPLMENLLAGLNLAGVPQALEGGQSCGRDGRGLLEGEVGRFRGEPLWRGVIEHKS